MKSIGESVEREDPTNKLIRPRNRKPLTPLPRPIALKARRLLGELLLAAQ